VIPPGSLILGKLEEYEFFHKEGELGVILYEDEGMERYGRSYAILYSDGSVGSEYEDYIRNRYEVISEEG
jgi:hypothetical protein